MTRRSRQKKSADMALKAAPTPEGADRLRPCWLFSWTALMVATPLLPSEAAASNGTGVVLIMLWWVVLVAWLVAGALRGRLELRVGLTTVALLLLVAWHSLSALAMSASGQPRAAWNALWLWLSFAVCFVLARQLIRTAAECRAVVAVMISLAVCLSTHGYYQYFYGLPKARRVYAKNPEEELAKAGVFAPPGSPERKQYEDRLQSTEPIATFTLTNSLAGFLSPWLLATLGIAATAGQSGGSRSRIWLAAAVSAVLILGCWILTKSRSAWLATLLGTAALSVYGWRTGWWRVPWRIAAIAAVALAVAAGFGVVAGGLDRLVLTESLKSFSYRTQYWRSTWALIGDHPWFGCGPGNFQQYYAAYKLPEASETVADPHNFLFEVWATAGTPAMLALIAMLAAFAWQLWSSAHGRDEPSGDPESGDAVRYVYWGALTGVIIAYFPCGYLVGYMPELAILVFGAPVAAVNLGLWHYWIQRGHLRRSVLVLAAATLLVNLLAAGGIGFAGVSLSLWGLLALSLNVAEGSKRPIVLARGSGLALAGAGLALLACCRQTEYDPVLRGSALLDRGESYASQGRVTEAERCFLDAAAADPWDAKPWQYLANLRHQKFLASLRGQTWPSAGPEDSFRAFQSAAKNMLALDRRSSRAFTEYGHWLLACFSKTNDAEHLREATDAYHSALDLYPNDSFGHAQLAWAQHLGGEVQQASAEADTALMLDARNPHREQKLANRRLYDPASEGTDSAGNAEQMMQRLRKPVSESP